MTAQANYNGPGPKPKTYEDGIMAAAKTLDLFRRHPHADFVPVQGERVAPCHLPRAVQISAWVLQIIDRAERLFGGEIINQNRQGGKMLARMALEGIANRKGKLLSNVQPVLRTTCYAEGKMVFQQ